MIRLANFDFYLNLLRYFLIYPSSNCMWLAKLEMRFKMVSWRKGFWLAEFEMRFKMASWQKGFWLVNHCVASSSNQTGTRYSAQTQKRLSTELAQNQQKSADNQQALKAQNQNRLGRESAQVHESKKMPILWEIRCKKKYNFRTANDKKRENGWYGKS